MTNDVDGVNRCGYDGEDFLSFEPKTLTWVAVQPQALSTKQKLDQNTDLVQALDSLYLHVCPERLKKYLEYSNKFKLKPGRILFLS